MEKPILPPLIVTRDETLLDELLRLAAASGSVPEVVSDPGASLGAWRSAPLVLVGCDVAESLARAAPPSRPGVQLVGWGPVGDQTFRHAVTLGAEQVSELPEAAAWLLEAFAECGDGARTPALSVAVMGGSGGAGATTLACALAAVAAEQGPCCLIDLDPWGPGVDRVLGLDGVEGARWEALAHAGGRIGARSLRETLPRRDGLAVLTWAPGPRAVPTPTTVHEAMAAAARGHPVVVADLPRSGELARRVLPQVGQVVLPVRPTLTGLAGAARVVDGIGDAAPVGLVVRGGGVEDAAVAEIVGAPVLAVMRDQPGLDEAVGLGRGPVPSRRSPLARTAWSLLDRLVGP